MAHIVIYPKETIVCHDLNFSEAFSKIWIGTGLNHRYSIGAAEKFGHLDTRIVLLTPISNDTQTGGHFKIFFSHENGKFRTWQNQFFEYYMQRQPTSSKCNSNPQLIRQLICGRNWRRRCHTKEDAGVRLPGWLVFFLRRIKNVRKNSHMERQGRLGFWIPTQLNGFLLQDMVWIEMQVRKHT